MQIKRKLIYKKIGDLKINSQVIIPNGDGTNSKAKVISIQEQGLSDIYKVELTDGRSFRVHLEHLIPVCFRTEDNNDIWENISAHYIIDHPEYNYQIMTDPSHMFESSMIYQHDYEPADVIVPRDKKDGVYIKSIIKETEKENCRCISLNDPLGIYYTTDGVLTHNSTVTCLMLLYVACLFGLMRDPWAYFAKAKTTVFGYALCAVTQTKAIETYVDQVKQLIGDSDFWMQCRTADEMNQEDKKLMESDSVEYLPWTTAVKSAQPMDAKIKMSDGSWKTMGELKIGDKLYSPDYGESEVVAFPYHGYGECYEIELEDGRKTRCSIDHKWKVAWKKVDYTDAWDWHIVDTRFLLSHPELEFEIYDKQPTL